MKDIEKKERCKQGGFLPQLTAAYNIAKVVKPASRIFKIVDIIPGDYGQLEGNAFGQVFLKGLDLEKSFGFGHPHWKHHRKGMGKHSTHMTRMHRRKAVHNCGRGMIIA